MSDPTIAATTLRARHHPDCVVCGPGCSHGLRLCFTLDAGGVAVTHFDCGRSFAGYNGLLHGGVIATLLDGAMTNCLFLHGIVAVTADLRVRYRHPVLLEERAEIRAWVAEPARPIYRLRAELRQSGRVKATAQATFFQRADGSDHV